MCREDFTGDVVFGLFFSFFFLCMKEEEVGSSCRFSKTVKVEDMEIEALLNETRDRQASFNLSVSVAKDTEMNCSTS